VSGVGSVGPEGYSDMEGQEVIERRHKEEEKRKRLLRVDDKKLMSRLKELGLEDQKKPTGTYLYL
jgi:hypothetical protein